MPFKQEAEQAAEQLRKEEKAEFQDHLWEIELRKRQERQRKEKEIL